MESKRQQKFARLIQKDLSEIFQRDAKSMFSGAFITVTEVKVSPDLGVARIYLSFLLAKNKVTLLEDIKEKGKAIRQMLAAKIKNQARIIPEIHFYLDESIEQASKIDELLSKIHIPPAPEENDTSKQ
jgi:ribosome-binding factor A